MMDVIDGTWIAARIGGEHGRRAALARAMGVTPDKVTKIIKGEREVQAREIPAILAFFTDPGPGLAESAAPFTLPPPAAKAAPSHPAVLTLRHVLAPGVRRPETFVMTRSDPGAMLRAGDMLIVELGNTARPGDLVLVTLNDPATDTQTTVVRRYLPPLVVSCTLDDDPAAGPADGTLEMAVLASIKAVIRLPPEQE
jgi:hypothetical protein